MQKAYDTFLQSEVSADLAAKSNGLEPYRYECVRCGEEVRLAAASSLSMVPHFRHRSGNNDVECENYFGQYGAISTDPKSRKSKSERAEFYFDMRTKMFYLGLRLNDNEITSYEELSTTFELRTSVQEQAFYSLLINNRNFAPNAPTMIPLKRFSNNYFLSNTLNGIKRKYEVFNSINTNTPTFFKIQGHDDNFKAKLVRSAVLYTNVQYFVAFQNQYATPYEPNLLGEVDVDDTFQFETMGRKFLGIVLSFKSETDHLKSWLASWGYRLEASETLTLLWPPAAQVDEISVIGADYAFLFSSFELHAHGNINIHSEDFEAITTNLSKVSVNTQIKLCKKNVEIVIEKKELHPIGFDNLQIEIRYENVYAFSDDRNHFFFSHSGVTPMSKGQSLLLTPGSAIRCYRLNYLCGCIHPRQQNELFGAQLLNDLLVHYRRTEKFDINDFDSCDLSATAFQYIEKCEESGLINSAAKQFIMERRL